MSDPAKQRLDTIDDGFGNVWYRCHFPDCDLHVVRPGKVQCSACDVKELRAIRDVLTRELAEARMEYISAVGQTQEALEQRDALRAVADAAQVLLSLTQNKGAPMSDPDNQRLYNAGDTILVNEGNLWALLGALSRLPSNGSETLTSDRTAENDNA